MYIVHMYIVHRTMYIVLINSLHVRCARTYVHSRATLGENFDYQKIFPIVHMLHAICMYYVHVYLYEYAYLQIMLEEPKSNNK